MKLVGKTKDGTIDGLLRAYVSRSGNLPHVCPDFDPDFANAYIERSLTADSRSRYEQHLSDCGACRKSVVALARLAEADGETSISSRRGEPRPAWLTRVVRGFSGLTAPQWATAVAAVIVLAISVPLILSRNEVRTTQDASEASAENQPASETSAIDQIARAVPPAAARKSGTEVAATTPKQSEKREAETIAANKAAAQPPSAAGNVSGGARADAVKAKAAPPADEVQAKTDRPASDAAAPAGAASELAKNESDKKRQQQNEKDSVQPGESKAVSAGEAGTAGKELANRVEEPPPPAPRSTPEPARSRKGSKQPGKLGLRDTSSEAARLPEKKILGKKFSLRDDVWTDKDYDPDKNQPVVNIVRDSNVYKEVLGKQAGLKAYLDAFHEGERAIIVYKGKVYKLIPQ